MKNVINLKSLTLLIILLVGTFSFSFSQNKTTTYSEFKLKIYFNDARSKDLLEKEVLKAEGVKSIKIDIKTKIAVITFDSNKTDRLKINNVIEKLGFETMITKNEKAAKKSCTEGATDKAPPAK